MIGLEMSDCFQLLFEHSRDASWLVDPVGPGVAGCNAAMARLTGWDHREELVGRHPAEIAPERQPDGLASRQKIEETIRLARERGGHRFEWLARRRDGTAFLMEVVLTAVEFGPRPWLLAISRDRSERQQVEADLRAAERHARLLFEQSRPEDITERRKAG